MDIRNFFPSTSKPKNGSKNDTAPPSSKKRNTVPTKQMKTKKRKVIISDSESDNDDVVKPDKKKPQIDDFTKPKTKKKAQIVEDDDDIIECSPDAYKKDVFNLAKKMKKVEENLKPSEAVDFFNKTPVKRSSFRVVNKAEPKAPPKTEPLHPELQGLDFDVHEDDDFALTLMQIDEESRDKVLSAEIVINDDSVDDIKDKDEVSIDYLSSQEKGVKTTKLKRKSEPDEEENKAKTPIRKKDAKNESRIDESDVGKTPEEKRKESALQYQRFLNRDGPRALGSKEIPEGQENCLQGLTFLLTGIFESLERDEAKDLIVKYNGKVMTTLSKNTTYMVVGRDAGLSKLDKAEKLGTKQLDEDGLLDLIRTRPSPKGSSKTPVKPSNITKTVSPPKEDEKPPLKKSKFFKNKETKTEKPTKETTKTPTKDADVIKIVSKEKESKIHTKGTTGSKTPTKDENIVKTGAKENTKPPPKDADVIKTNSKEIKKNTEPPVKEISKYTKIPPKETTKISHIKSGSSLNKVAPSFMWVDKHKPTSLKQVIGQQGEKSNAKKLLCWLSNWHKNRSGPKKAPARWGGLDDGSTFKAVLLSGPPGIGKTTTAQLACKELKIEFTEMNASDTRSKKNLQQEVMQLLQNTTLTQSMKDGPRLSSKHAIIMDEVDGMSGNEDRGGTQELIALIKGTKIPIICICNDRSHPKIRSLSNYCFDLRFQKPRMEQIKGALMSVAFKEGIKIPADVLGDVIAASNQDVRQCLHNLSLWSAKNNNTHNKMSTKDIKLGPFDVLKKVFAMDEANSNINDKSSLFFHDYSISPLFVQENYLQVKPAAAKGDIVKHLELISQSADSIRDGDLIDRMIRSTNNWSLLPTQAMFASVIPGDTMRGYLSQMISFPSWLGKNSTRNHMDRVLQQLQMHTRLRTSCNKTELNTHYLPLLQNRLTSPLVDKETEGVKEVLDTMESYFLMREDLDIVAELNTWPGKKDPMASVNPKVKAALTRTYNKEGFLNPYSVVTIKKSRKQGSEGGLEGADGEGELEEEEEEDNIEKDAMVKKKKPTKTATKSTKTTAKATKKDNVASTSKGKGAKGKK